MSTFDPNAAASADSGAFGLPHTPQQAHVVLVPVPYEATCSYGGGTSRGPAAILAASRQVDLFDVETGRPYQRGIAMLESPADVAAWNDEGRPLAAAVIAAGGRVDGNKPLQDALNRVNVLSEKMNAWVRDTVESHLRDGKLVATVGGDHSVSFGAIEAHVRKYPGMGILHVDAHADLRNAYEGFTWSHASIFHNVMTRLDVPCLVQVGIRDFCEEEHDMARKSAGRIRMHHDATVAALLCEGQSWNTLCERMILPLPQQVYLSFDIDGLDPALCPSTGTPVPGGLSFHQALALIRAVVKSGRRLVGFDLTEVTPGGDGNEWDANVGARLLYKMVGWSLASGA
jgi:agmatinase